MPESIEFQTDVSLITGEVRNLGRDEHLESSSTTVVPRNQATAVTEVNAQTAGKV